MTDRPDDLVAEARYLVTHGGEARPLVARLADALEAEKARVRQLEEVLRKIADRDYVTRERGDPIPATIDGRAGSIIYVEGLAPWQIAREVQAAKENTTP